MHRTLSFLLAGAFLVTLTLGCGGAKVEMPEKKLTAKDTQELTKDEKASVKLPPPPKGAENK